VVLVPTSSPIFELPPKLKGMRSTLAPLSTNHTSSDLILNDSFVRIIEEKKKNGTFGVPYENIVAFLSKVSLFVLFPSHFDCYVILHILHHLHLLIFVLL
jgi:hypothetical protein